MVGFLTGFKLPNQKLGIQVELGIVFTTQVSFGFLILIGLLVMVGPNLVAFVCVSLFFFVVLIQNHIAFSSSNSVTTQGEGSVMSCD